MEARQPIAAVVALAAEALEVVAAVDMLLVLVVVGTIWGSEAQQRQS